MNVQEFSSIFDTMLNSYNNSPEFGKQTAVNAITLDEYEKSVLLTQAQDIIIKQYFDKTQNTQQQGLDDSARRQMDFSSLVTLASITPNMEENPLKYDSRSILFSLPEGVETTEVEGEQVTTGYPKPLLILNEKLLVTKNDKNKEYIVIPINYQEYDRQMSKPYTQPLKKQCWRIFNANKDNETKAELILNDANKGDSYEYKLRYIRRPRPIILTELESDGLNIDGETSISECELNPIIHMDILVKAVEMALTRGMLSTPRQSRDNQ